MARLHRLDGHIERSLAILGVAAHLCEVDAAVYFEMGQGYAMLDRVDRALEMYRVAVRIDPDFREAYWELGALLEQRGHIDEALEAWRRSDVTRDAYRHSLFLAAALKSPTATNETLLAMHLEWSRHHARGTASG